MTNSKGFTLIELVVVIVILGILSATAAPRFLNVQSDARIASLDAFIGAFKSADGIVMGKAMMTGVEHSQEATVIPGTSIEVVQNHMLLTADNIKKAMDTSGYNITQMYDDHNRRMLLVVYQGDKMSKEEVAKNTCMVILSRHAISIYEDDSVDFGGLHIRPRYDGC